MMEMDPRTFGTQVEAQQRARELNAKEKAPERRQPHRAQKNKFYTVIVSRNRRKRNEDTQLDA